MDRTTHEMLSPLALLGLGIICSPMIRNERQSGVFVSHGCISAVEHVTEVEDILDNMGLRHVPCLIIST